MPETKKIKGDMRALISTDDNNRIKSKAANLGISIKEFFHRVSFLPEPILHKLLVDEFFVKHFEAKEN